MHLTVLLPDALFAHREQVDRIVVETCVGSMGLLPRRLDCVVPLVPGILEYQTLGETRMYIALNGGILMKSGPDVTVVTTCAVACDRLEGMGEVTELRQKDLSNRQQRLHQNTRTLEADLLRRLRELRHE
jgi:F-type H+-transporting ATPase subunit epsilon